MGATIARLWSSLCPREKGQPLRELRHALAFP